MIYSILKQKQQQQELNIIDFLLYLLTIIIIIILFIVILYCLFYNSIVIQLDSVEKYNIDFDQRTILAEITLRDLRYLKLKYLGYFENQS